MIKVTDLMVGDWVQHDDKPKMIMVIWPYSVSLDDPEKTWGSIYADKISIEEIQPIELTSEILEKNGFVMSKMRSWQLREGTLYASWKHNWLNIFAGVAPIANTHSKCTFVHELQHALKLCGTEKEVIL